MTASDRQPAAPDWVRRPANLASAVTAELVGRVVRGVHPPGTSLPAEPVLCESFAVSRTVVREAVKLLQAKGLVQVRQGAGTVVNPASMWNMLDELVLAAVIAEDETSAVLDDLVVTHRLGELVELMDQLVDDPVAYREQDLAFHDTIMQVSGNRLARGVVRALESQVVNTARYVGPSGRALCVASNKGHRRVYERIAAGDPDGAGKAMFDHITEAWLARRPDSGDPGRLER
jgi:DNA-binding FadR family transcriptional regulator